MSESPNLEQLISDPSQIGQTSMDVIKQLLQKIVGDLRSNDINLFEDQVHDIQNIIRHIRERFYDQPSAYLTLRSVKPDTPKPVNKIVNNLLDVFEAIVINSESNQKMEAFKNVKDLFTACTNGDDAKSILEKISKSITCLGSGSLQ
jgi:uncharacterized protein YpuA (DUF1002 family)